MPGQQLLFVSHEMSLSGAPIQLAYLVQWLRRRGWGTTVVAPEPGPLAEHLAGVKILYESQLLIDPTYGTLRRLAPQFDAVIANTVATWEAVQACRAENVPVIWYLHETLVGRQLMDLVYMIEQSLPVADEIIVPTRATAAIYEPFVRKPSEIVPYGIPAVGYEPSQANQASACSRSEVAPPSDRVRFAVIGTLESRKGQDVLLDAVHQLPAAIAVQASFHLAGRDLEPAFVAALRERAATLPNVHFCGALEHHEAIQLLHACDVLICPSRDETMPIVLLEAMSLGRPLICADVGGISESIVDDVNGLVVPSEDPDALGAAISRIVGDANLRHRLGSAGRATFDQHFTLDRFGERFAAIIKRAIGARRAAIS